MIAAPSPSLHILAGLADRDGGPAYSVPALVGALADLGHPASIWTVARPGDALSGPQSAPARRFPPRPGLLPRLLRQSPDLDRALRRTAAAPLVLHGHGLWLAPNLYPAAARRASGARAKWVQSPRGMLAAEALKISAMRKRWMWRLAQRRALVAADCLHATAVSEYEEIRAAGLVAPVAVIRNGVHLPELPARRRPDAQRTVLYLGRLHAKKGLDELLRAWATVERAAPAARLRIVGPSEGGYAETLRGLAAELRLAHAMIEPPLFEPAAKLAAYRDADLVVLPTRNENFGMTVAEALAAETPVIATTGAPWAGLLDNRCGWWIDHGAEPLAATLISALAVPAHELDAHGPARPRLDGARFRLGAHRRRDGRALRMAAAGRRAAADGAPRMTLAAPTRRPLTRRAAPGLPDVARRALWMLVWATLFRLSPPPLHGWRRGLLILCGAEVGRGAHVYPSARIRAPWKLKLGPYSCLAPGVECYNVDRIELEEAAIVSQRAFLCAASHDYQRRDFALVAAPIVVGRHAWVAAEAFVGPGVRIGEGAVVAARAVATRDVAPWSCVAGNPARIVGQREPS